MSAKSNAAVYPSLENRVVLVTGGATGIGEAIVEAFARQRAQVAFIDIQEDEAKGLVGRLVDAGLRAPVYFHCDLTDFVALDRKVAEVARAVRAGGCAGEQCGQRCAAFGGVGDAGELG